jgi:hypothetical protein
LGAGLFAFAAACAFVGAALYVNVVEQPARLRLDARAMVREWKPSDRRGFVLLATLALLAAILAYLQYARSGDVRWIIGGTITLASWPYAYFVIVPVNIWLYAIRPEGAAAIVRDLMRAWGLLEWGHTAIGLFGATVFAWALVLPA